MEGNRRETMKEVSGKEIVSLGTRWNRFSIRLVIITVEPSGSATKDFVLLTKRKEIQD
jgi:hypothetical protein